MQSHSGEQTLQGRMMKIVACRTNQIWCWSAAHVLVLSMLSAHWRQPLREAGALYALALPTPEAEVVKACSISLQVSVVLEHVLSWYFGKPLEPDDECAW